MHKIVQETLLIRFASNLGDMALISVSKAIYGSSLFQFLLFCFLSLSILSLAWGIHKREVSKRSIFAAIAIFLAYPSGGKPIGYRVVNALSRASATVFQKGIESFVGNHSNLKGSDNLPSGLALELFVTAASSKLKSEEARSLLYGLTMNCLRNALTKTGERASFEDFFKFKSHIREDSATGTTVVSFTEETLNEKALRNDNSFSRVIPGKNCFDGLTITRTALMSDLEGEPLYLTNSMIGGSEENPYEMKDWIDRWKAKVPKLHKLALNLRLAHAAAHEKSRIIKDLGWDPNNPGGDWWYGTNTDRSLRELTVAMDFTTEFGYRLSDLKNLFSNIGENRWAFSLGASIKDLKERIELLPYQLASLKILLKIVFPLVILTLFLGTFKFFFVWSGAWTVSVLTPAIVSASRSINNSVLLSKLGIEDLTKDEGLKALAYGVDISSAKQLLSDFTPLAYSMIEQEMSIIRYLTGAMLVGSWLAGGGANGFVSWTANSIQGFLTSSSLGGGVNIGSAVIGKSLEKIGMPMGSAAHWMGERTRSLVDSIRTTMPPIGFTGHNAKRNMK